MIETLELTDSVRSDVEALTKHTGRPTPEVAEALWAQLPSWAPMTAGEPPAPRWGLIDLEDLVHVSIPADPDEPATLRTGLRETHEAHPEVQVYGAPNQTPFEACARHIVQPLGLEPVADKIETDPSQAPGELQKMMAVDSAETRKKMAWKQLFEVAMQFQPINGDPFPLTRATIADLRSGDLTLDEGVSR